MNTKVVKLHSDYWWSIPLNKQTVTFQTVTVNKCQFELHKVEVHEAGIYLYLDSPLLEDNLLPFQHCGFRGDGWHGYGTHTWGQRLLGDTGRLAVGRWALHLSLLLNCCASKPRTIFHTPSFPWLYLLESVLIVLVYSSDLIACEESSSLYLSTRYNNNQKIVGLCTFDLKLFMLIQMLLLHFVTA